MCPACITTAALIASLASTTGGLTALVVKKFCAKNIANQIPTQTKSKENHDGQ
jgi:hypothetical protein